MSTLFQTIMVPLASLALLVWAYWSWSWMGLAMVVSAMVMWLLLHYTRLMHIFKQASRRPIGHVDSAVMLHVKLRPNMPLIKVIALTKSLGAVEAASFTSTSDQAQAPSPSPITHPRSAPTGLGEGLLTPAQASVQPLSAASTVAVQEVFIWRDAQDSFVRCEFEGGRLKAWALTRPPQEPSAEATPQPQPQPPLTAN